METYAIQVVNLSKYFGPVCAVADISFHVKKGATTALLGGNGAGKTTTLSAMVGLLLPTSGKISILGVDMLNDRYSALGRMNYSSPYVDLPHRLTVKDNLSVFSGLYGIKNSRQTISRLAEELNLTDFLNRAYGNLSAGQKTRVALAKALLNEPEVLLMDEPTASLDPDMADYVRSYLMKYQEQSGATLLLASHNMNEVERICDDVVMLREGRLVDSGTPAGLIAKYGRDNLEQVFIDISRHARHEDLNQQP